jgi:hypothetical protein
MADKIYRLSFLKSDGTEESVEFTAPQGPKGDPGAAGKDGVVDVSGATVGQTIIVTAVDGNGRPTAWEAVDYQPRTHWVEAGGEIVHKLDNKFIDAEWMATTEKSIVIPDGSYQNGFGELVLTGKNLETELYKGNTYRVVFEGVSYECVAIAPESDDFAYDFGENALILGNARVLEEAYGYDAGAYGEDTGEPFCLAQYGENWDVYLGGEWTEKEAMVCFGIYRVTEVPIKLPEKFMPYERLAWVDPSGINPYFDNDLTGRVLIPISQYRTYVKITDKVLTEAECVGHKVTRVSSNGDVITRKVYEGGIVDVTEAFNGLPAFTISVESTEGAVLVIRADVPSYNISAGTYYASDTNDAGKQYISYFSALDDVIHKIDEKFLPVIVDGIIFRSSTEGSTKTFKLHVNDVGVCTTEVIV